MPLTTVAWAPSPLAFALSPMLPSGVEAVAVPFCTRTTPFIEMLMFCPGAFGFADDEPGDEDELESDGFADAAHGVADSPTPMPSATANAPTRPT